MILLFVSYFSLILGWVVVIRKSYYPRHSKRFDGLRGLLLLQYSYRWIKGNGWHRQWGCLHRPLHCRNWCCLLLLLHHLQSRVLERYPSMRSHLSGRSSLRKLVHHGIIFAFCGLRLPSDRDNNELPDDHQIFSWVLPQHSRSHLHGDGFSGPSVLLYQVRWSQKESQSIWRAISWRRWGRALGSTFCRSKVSSTCP